MVFIWETLKKVSSATFEGIIDGMYVNAALGHRNWIDLILLTALVMIGMNVTIVVALKLNSKVNDIREDKVLDSMSEEDLKNQLIVKQSELENEISKLEKMLILMHKFLWPILIITAICGVQFVFSSFTDLQLNTSFNQRMNALAPYITDHEIKVLNSKWALMKTRKDYIEINIHLDSLAKSAKIILPENLLD